MKRTDFKFCAFARIIWIAVVLALCEIVAPRSAQALGYWTPLAQQAPGGIELMLLLSDGTVMAQSSGGASWFHLIPDNHGSYVNGRWTNDIPDMHESRTFYASAVLRDGRVFVSGGEYPSGGSQANDAEVYNPTTHLWTQPIASGGGIDDSQCVMLPDGRVLVGLVGWLPNYPALENLLFDPATMSWAQATTNLVYQNEGTWVKLPDDSILTVDPSGAVLSSERYIPAQGRWVVDAVPPVQLFSPGQGGVGTNETGAALLLPDGRALFIGGTGRTLIYTPTSNTSPGQWATGPNIPLGLVSQDAPSAMMVNGKILCEVSSLTNHTPVYFYEYDAAVTNFIATSSPGNSSVGSSLNAGSDHSYMLDLPDGTVLYSLTSSQLYVYNPNAAPLTTGKPTVSNISANASGVSYHLTGTRLNGISQGAAYGDDAQMDSNYPLVRLTNSLTGNVYYTRTYNWSSTSVMTGNTPVTTEFELPPSVLSSPGAYSLVVVANGNPSDPVPFSVPASTWVDFTYTGSPQNGNYANPFSTLAQATNAVASGGTIAIKGPTINATGGAASSPGGTKLSNPMRLVAMGGQATIGH